MGRQWDDAHPPSDFLRPPDCARLPAVSRPYLDIGGPESLEGLLPELHRSFGQGMSLEEYGSYQRALADHHHARRAIRTLVLRGPDDRALSHLRLHAVRGLSRSEDVVLGGIAMVLTPEAQRGQGHASLIIEATLDLLRREGVDGAYLFSDIDPCFYERFGFRRAATTEFEEAVSSLPARGPDSVIVRETSPNDQPAIRRIHERAGEGEALWLLRDADRWDFLLARPQLRARYTLGSDQVRIHQVAERDGSIAGYAIAALESERLWIDELCMDRPDPELATALLASLAMEARERSIERFSAPRPPGRFGVLLESQFSAIPRREGIFMVAALSPRLDLEVIAAETGGFWETDHI